jgi:hypothetical protein
MPEPSPNQRLKERKLVQWGVTRNGVAPHFVVLVALWVLIVATLLFLLAQGVRQTDERQVLRWVLQGLYVACLVWYLARTGPSLAWLSEIPPLMLKRWRGGPWIPVVFVALLFLFVLGSSDGADIVLLLTIPGATWVLLAWWRKIRLGLIVQGLALAAIAFLAGLQFYQQGFVSEIAYFLLAGMTAPMYVAGALLVERTRVGTVRLPDGIGNALKGFLWGCLLFVPMGLFNAADGSPGSGFEWVNQWWMTPVQPLFSGVAEETLWRLLLLPLCYLLLRPAFPKHPAVPLVAAVVFSAVAFGLGHGYNLDRLLTTGLMYGLAMAAAFARRSYEHAVGAHYMVNFIPWVMVFLAN